MPENVCNNRMRNRDTSLYANYQVVLGSARHEDRSTLRWAYLLSETYPRSSIKGEEYKWIRQEILP